MMNRMNTVQMPVVIAMMGGTHAAANKIVAMTRAMVAIIIIGINLQGKF